MTVVRANRPTTRICIGILGGMLLTGCAPAKKSSLPQPPATQPRPDRWGAAASVRRVHNLSREAENLATDARTLPGHDAAEHSRIMQRVFTDLLQTLPLLGNPTDDRVLAQRMTIIQNSRARLSSGSTADRVEPIIVTALRAASSSLADLSHGDGFAPADLGPDLDKLSAQINRLDLENDPSLHRVDVAEAVDLISNVVSKMAASLSATLTAEQPAAPQPATQPTAPATQPAHP